MKSANAESLLERLVALSRESCDAKHIELLFNVQHPGTQSDLFQYKIREQGKQLESCLN